MQVFLMLKSLLNFIEIGLNFIEIDLVNLNILKRDRVRENWFFYFFERLILLYSKTKFQKSKNWSRLGCWVGNSSPSPGSPASLNGGWPQRN